ncbi:MAG: elongation factor 1-beta [Nanoarchaeota archaeon]
MAQVIITLKIMPESVDSPLDHISKQAEAKISAFGGEVGKKEIEEIAFGLKAINLVFVMDEKKGSTESLEQDIAGIEGVASAEVTDVRRAIG